MTTTAPYPRMHVSLYVTNLDSAIAFYRQFFDTDPEKVKAHYAKFLLEKPALVISFVENPGRVNPNFGHLGIQVETREEMNHKLEAMRTANLLSKVETGTACCYAVQDKFWVNDPDGHQWEVYYFQKDVEFNDPHYEMEDSSSCCMPAPDKKDEGNLAKMDKAEACCEPGSGCC